MNGPNPPVYTCSEPFFKKLYQLFFQCFIGGWILCSTTVVFAQLSKALPLPAPFWVIKDSTRLVDQLTRRALGYQLKSMDSCYKYADSALRVATRQQYPHGKADAFRVLGNYYSLTTNKYLSYRYARDARQLYEALKDTVHLAAVIMNQAVYYERDSAHLQAVSAIYTAMELAGRLPQDSIYAHVLANYYFIHRKDSTKQDSLQWAETKAIEIAHKYNNKILLLYLPMQEADRMLPMVGYAVTAQVMDSLYKIALAQGDYYLVLHNSRYMASYASRYHQADSIRYLTRMVDAGVAGGFNGLIMNAADKLYHYYNQRNKRDSAARYGSIMLDALRFIEVSKSKGEVDYMGYFMQDQQMHRLRAAHESQQQDLEKNKMEQRNLVLASLAAGILLLLMSGVIVYVIQSSKRHARNARQLEVLNKEINEKNAALKTNDDFKNMMISLIAHDFRLPLANVLDVTMLLKRKTFTLEEAAALIIKAEATASNTLVVFDNILRWIRTQLSGFAYQPVPCDPTALILTAWEGLKSLADEKGIQLVVNIQPSLRIYGNQEMLQFVHRNLLHNALKFSPGGTDITVSAKRTDGFVTVTFSDQGKGIPADLLSRLFAFNIHTSTGVQQAKGAGLALIICKDFITKMNGNIQAGNNARGGSSFWYTLPDLDRT
jgi:signal transduction histidine kinase